MRPASGDTCPGGQGRHTRSGWSTYSPALHCQCTPISKFNNDPFTEMCGGSEAGSKLKRIDFLCHSIPGLRVRIRSPPLKHLVTKSSPLATIKPLSDKVIAAALHRALSSRLSLGMLARIWSSR